MAYVKKRANGTYEIQVTHKLLPKRFYGTADTEEQARSYGARLEDMLNRGIVPPELQAKAPVKRTKLSVVLGDYLRATAVAKSDEPVVQQLRGELQIDIEDVTVAWCDRWIQDKKRVHRLAPGTIRKHVESLARAVDWWNRKQHQPDAMPANPLRTLPKAYSRYNKDDGEERVDEKRDRRLAPGEHETIVEALKGKKSENRERPLKGPHAEDFLLLYLLIVNTALRLREAYCLRVSDLRFGEHFIFVRKSKTGPERTVPLSPEVQALLEAHPLSKDPEDPVFKLWNGDESNPELMRTTGRLSQRFSTLFEYCGLKDLTEHDLRHEGVCRWMLMRNPSGGWEYRAEEVMKISGHESPVVFARYLSLRGSDLADRMWSVVQPGQRSAA